MSDRGGPEYLARVEWESLDHGELGEFSDFGPLPSDVSHVSVARSEDYRLVAVARGTFKDRAAFEAFRSQLDGQAIAGSVSQGHAIDASNERETLRIEGAYVQRTNTNLRMDDGNWHHDFELSLGASRLVWSDKGRKGAWLTDWFVNGPQDSVWTRLSSRRTEAWYWRRWGHRPEDPERRFPGVQRRQGALSHFRVETPLTRFTVHGVPEGIGPAWSSNIGIEFEPREDETFPDDDLRTSIAEVVGFVLGRRLIPIGSTVFDELGQLVATTARQPWGNNVRAVCAMPELPPVNVSRPQGGTNIEALLVSFLPRYVELRGQLRLGDALWRLWLGNEAPLGLNLPIYSAGIEMLANAWFKASGSKPKGVYMPKNEFDAALKDVFDLAMDRLASEEYKERIIRRMRGAFQPGAAERTEWFFEQIGLPLGEQERAAMKARNAPAHGGDQGATQAEIEDLIRHADAYKTLFARTILKLLGYTGPYIDRRTLGFPQRPIDVPAGG